MLIAKHKQSKAMNALSVQRPKRMSEGSKANVPVDTDFDRHVCKCVCVRRDGWG